MKKVQTQFGHVVYKTLLAKPTAFEKFLQAEGISEADVPRSQKAQQWIRKHYKNTFIPESILSKVNLTLSEAEIDGNQ